MLRIPGRIPITIHPAFWIFAALIGFINSFDFLGTLIWVAIILVSVLFHEFGHALTAALFGQHPRIELVALGGLTYHDGEKLPFWKQFFITLDGPLFGFILYIIATLLLEFTNLKQGMSGAILTTFQWVNFFWTLVNLLPVMPLDGGQLLRIVLEAFFGVRGLKYTLMVGVIIAVLISLFFFLYQQFIIGALFFLLAYQSYDMWRRTRFLTEKDRSGDLKKALENAENNLQAGKKEEALAGFEKIRKDTKQGMIYDLATQYLAFLNYEMGKTRESYELLLPLRKELPAEALCLLHRAAFDEKDYPLVVELAGLCFQSLPNAETALRNASACAVLKQVHPAIGWLQTALEQGVLNLDEILLQEIFNPIRQDPSFQHFSASLKPPASS